MENLNTNSENQNDLEYYKNKYEQVQKQRDDLVYKVKIEVEKREALENKIASFLDPIIESKLDDFKVDLEEKVYELESRIDDIDNEDDILDKVNEHINDLISDGRLTAKIELDWSMPDTQVNIKPNKFFHTPDDWDALEAWINLHYGHERLHVMTAACMAWNLACKYVNDANDQ